MRRCVGYCYARLGQCVVGSGTPVSALTAYACASVRGNGAHQQLVRIGHHIENPSRMRTLASLEQHKAHPRTPWRVSAHRTVGLQWPHSGSSEAGIDVPTSSKTQCRQWSKTSAWQYSIGEETNVLLVVHAVVVDGVVRASDVESGPGSRRHPSPTTKVMANCSRLQNARIVKLLSPQPECLNRSCHRASSTATHSEDNSDSAECTDPMENWQDAEMPALFPSQTTQWSQCSRPSHGGRFGPSARDATGCPGACQCEQRIRGFSELFLEVLEQGSRTPQSRKFGGTTPQRRRGRRRRLEEAERQFRENLEADVKAKHSSRRGIEGRT